MPVSHQLTNTVGNTFSSPLPAIDSSIGYAPNKGEEAAVGDLLCPVGRYENQDTSQQQSPNALTNLLKQRKKQVRGRGE